MNASGFDTTAPSPRVNFELMNQYIGKRVKLVGKVEDVQGGKMRVKAADDGVVEVILQSAAPQDAFVEIDGTVESPNTLREEGMTGFGNSFGTIIEVSVFFVSFAHILNMIIIYLQTWETITNFASFTTLNTRAFSYDQFLSTVSFTS